MILIWLILLMIFCAFHDAISQFSSFTQSSILLVTNIFYATFTRKAIRETLNKSSAAEQRIFCPQTAV